MFGPPKHKKLSEVISITNPEMARGSVKEAKSLVRKGYYSKATVKKAFVLAANRCEAMLNRKSLSMKERRELKTVAGIYRRAAKTL